MYTRSIRRRLIATILDVIAAFVVTMIVLYPFANTLDSPLRVNGGIWFVERCAPGVAYAAPEVLFSREGWDAIFICDKQSNSVFPSRTAVFYDETVSGSTKSFKKLAIPLNSRNEAYIPFDAIYLAFFVLAIVATLFEASRFQATPGKMIVRVYVSDAVDGEQTLVRCLARNTMKYLYGILVAAVAVATGLGFYNPFDGAFAPGEPRVTLDLSQVFNAAIGPLVIGIVWTCLLLSALLPWSKAGRGLYDRLSGCFVRQKF